MVTDGFDKKGSGKMKPPLSGNPLGIVDIHRGCGLPRVSLGSRGVEDEAGSPDAPPYCGAKC